MVIWRWFYDYFKKNKAKLFQIVKLVFWCHGPTFMADPLACSVANASIDLLLESNWQDNVKNIWKYFYSRVTKMQKGLKMSKDVRNIGVIGVIELIDDCYAQKVQDYCVKNSIALRPFGKLVYSIVAYTISRMI